VQRVEGCSGIAAASSKSVFLAMLLLVAALQLRTLFGPRCKRHGRRTARACYPLWVHSGNTGDDRSGRARVGAPSMIQNAISGEYWKHLEPLLRKR